MEELLAARRREFLTRAELVPALPDVVVRLLALLGRDDTDAADIEAVLACDAVLTARLLAMVNSPWFGLNRRISTLRDAVTMTGFRGLRTLVVAVSAAKYLQRDYCAYGHGPKGLWLHALAVATGSREMGLMLQLPAEKTEQLFVAGLLHDLGMFVLAPVMRGLPSEWLEGRTVSASEIAATGIDHAAAGALIAAKWHLDESLQAVLAGHHSADVGAANPVVAIVRIADAVAESAGIGYEPGRAPKTAVHDLDLTPLGLTQSSWAPMHDTVLQSMFAAERSLVAV